MKKYLVRFTGTGLLLLGLAGTAFGHPHFGQHFTHAFGHPHAHAPELDPTLIGSGLAFVAGAALLLVERYRRR